ncbi:MAG: RAD55 family ATPase [Halobacteriaceae archaeon]
MYELGGSFGSVAVEPGTNLLVTGPPMTGKRTLAYEALATGSRQDEGAVIVTTKDDAESVIDEYERRDIPEDSLVGVIDCVTRQQGMSGVQDEEFVRYASSPVDLTGIGIELSELLRAFYQEHDVRRNRILLYSISTLLMYSDLQTVFRFLHVFTGRIQSADALGLFIIDSTTHDEQELSTLKQLFDGVIEVEEADDGTRRHRLAGIDDIDAEWVEA